MFICMPKINFIIHFFLEILHFKESCNLIDRHHNSRTRISSDMGLMVRYNNISFRFRLFPGKTNDKFFKTFNKTYIGSHFGSFFPKFWQKGIFIPEKNDNDDFIGPSIGRGFNNETTYILDGLSHFIMQN